MALPEFWLKDQTAARVLAPLARLFEGAIKWRRRRLERRATSLPVPVVIVGSIFIGGTGKTPLVSWLAALAVDRGYRPGIVLRGYGGRHQSGCLLVDGDTDPLEAGDEAVVTARVTGLPVIAARDRVAGARALIRDHDCNLVIADDGLQHYRLGRDVEIGVLDSRRGVGNGRCLPAGPLREPIGRLGEVDLVVINGGPRPDLGNAYFRLRPGQLRPVGLEGPERIAPRPGTRVHAVAGIGEPARFFTSLREAGFDVVAHPFTDHHRFTADDLAFEDEDPVIMTPKDAVKCESFDDGRLWYLPVELEASPELMAAAVRVFDGPIMSRSRPDDPRGKGANDGL